MTRILSISTFADNLLINLNDPVDATVGIVDCTPKSFYSSKSSEKGVTKH